MTVSDRRRRLVCMLRVACFRDASFRMRLLLRDEPNRSRSRAAGWIFSRS